MAVKEQLRQVPNRGIGNGLMRYLCDDEEVVRQLRTLPEPEMSLNYLGQFDQALDGPSSFRPALEYTGPERSLRGTRSHLLDINGGIAGGQLQLEWTYSESVHRRTTIERLAQDFVEALQALIAHCKSPEAGGYTASDFAEFDWSEEDFEDIVAEVSKLVQ
jgi:non-ribosomal peptide synthase protein (TIGR01720 family)